MNILEVRNLKKYFPIRRGLFYKTIGYVKAVDGISFSLTQGKTLGIVGESGSGKTTLAKLITKLILPDSGSIYMADKETVRLNDKEFRKLRKDVQLVFQDPFGSLDPRFMVKRIIEEGMELLDCGKRSGEKHKKVKELLSMVGIGDDALYRFPHEFSGGQRQRISIARSLAANPKLLILDEPVSSLDLSIQAQIINLLLELQENLKLSYIFIAHDLRVIRHVSDQICVMYKGKILERADSEEIFVNPLHPYTKLLLSSIPVLGKKRKPLKELEADTEAKENKCRFLSRCLKKDKICRQLEPELEEVSYGHFVCCLKAK